MSAAAAVTPASSASSPRYVVGVDVGTASARAGVVDARDGRCLATAVAPLQMHSATRADHFEYSSEQIWAAVCQAVRRAVQQAGVAPESIEAIGFDATCSTVLLDKDARGLSVTAPATSASAGSSAASTAAPATASPAAPLLVLDTIAWLDHRAVAEAGAITASKHPALASVGGTLSPEGHVAKLAWIKTHLPATWSALLAGGAVMDLTDFLSHRASGSRDRSVCTVSCKTGFNWALPGGGAEGWPVGFFRSVGLEELTESSFAVLGSSQSIRAIGSRAGKLTPRAAQELGLHEEVVVSVGLIDAHAGALGSIGCALPATAVAAVPLDSASASPSAALPASPAAAGQSLSGRMAVIAGTSSCHLACSPSPAFVPGVWGPYLSALLPDLWLSEGGESATGSMLALIVDSHPSSADVRTAAKTKGVSVYAHLESVLARLAAERGLSDVAFLSRDVHVLPYFHGNRSPRADASLLGVFSGLTLACGEEDLAVKFLAAMQALAYGTRHIRETMRAHGVDTTLLCMSGGLSKSALFVQQHADANGCTCVLPREPDAVLLGAAITAATAVGVHASLIAAMTAMTHSDRIVLPAAADSDVARFHERKYRVFLKMHEDQQSWKKIMEE